MGQVENVWSKVERKSTFTTMRPYVLDESMEGVSVSDADKELPTLEGGMIARDDGNPKDQWYINPTYLAANFKV